MFGPAGLLPELIEERVSLRRNVRAAARAASALEGLRRILLGTVEKASASGTTRLVASYLPVRTSDAPNLANVSG